MNKIIFIAYPVNFKNARIFSEKTEKILSRIENFKIITTTDHNNFLKNKFPTTDITELGFSKKNSEIKRILSKADHFIAFWDGTELDQYIYNAQLLDVSSRIITIETTKVSNRDKGDDYDVYIGRGTPWGNPFAIGHDGMSRDDVIEKYREFFNVNIANSPEKIKELKGLKNKTLGCHCKPAACHGDIIADFLNALDE